MLWSQIGRVLVTIFASAGAAGGASAIMSDEPINMAIQGIVTGVATLVALFMRSPKTPKN